MDGPSPWVKEGGPLSSTKRAVVASRAALVALAALAAPTTVAPIAVAAGRCPASCPSSRLRRARGSNSREQWWGRWPAGRRGDEGSRWRRGSPHGELGEAQVGANVNE
jgi:hypothetical protein